MQEHNKFSCVISLTVIVNRNEYWVQHACSGKTNLGNIYVSIECDNKNCHGSSSHPWSSSKGHSIPLNGIWIKYGKLS